MWKNSVMPEHKYMLHSSYTWFFKSSDQDSLKKILVADLVNRYAAVKQLHKVKKNYKRDLKALKEKKQYDIQNVQSHCFTQGDK